MFLRRGEPGSWLGSSYLGLCGGPSFFTSFTGPASIFPFKPDIWACVLGLRAYNFKTNKF